MGRGVDKPKAYILYSRLFELDGSGMTVGGIQTYLLNLAKIFEEKKYDTVIIQQANNDFVTEYNGLTIKGFKIKSNHIGKGLFSRIHSVLSSEDIVVWGTDAISCKTNHKRTIGIQHGIAFDYYPLEEKKRRIALSLGFGKLVKYLQRYKARLYFKNSTYKVCVDYNFLNWYRTFCLPGQDKNIWTIPNFAERSTFKSREININDIRIVFARRFQRKRGIEIFIQASKILLEKHKNISICFAGEGPYEDLITKELSEHIEKITITKYASEDSLKFHSQFNIAVIPTLGSEGTSLSLLEAMSSGLAVIATNVGGMTNIILDKFNGLMISPAAEDIVNSLEDLIIHPDLIQKLGENAKISVDDSFSLHLWKEKWLNVINHVEKF